MTKFTDFIIGHKEYCNYLLGILTGLSSSIITSNPISSICGIIFTSILFYFVNYNIKLEQKLLYYLNKSSWQSTIISGEEMRICNKNEKYQIIKKRDTEPFSGIRTKSFFDDRSFKHLIQLKINGEILKEYGFISCDGGRILVPIPKIENKGSEIEPKIEYYWLKDSIYYKICNIIREYYTYTSIEEIGKKCNVKIR